MRATMARLAGGVAAALLWSLLAAPVVLAQTYDLNFTLPTAGKSGCMVCHGDPDLVRAVGGQLKSYYVDEQAYLASAHGRSKRAPSGVMCTGCHVDFAYKAPHNISQVDWKRTARLACKNCHPGAFEAYGKGVHTIAAKPGEKADPEADRKPLCGDCHGAHDIERLTDDSATVDVDEGAIGRKTLHRRGREVCGNEDCHAAEWDTYDDYYHGAAYKRGASDAPACWDCHGSHDVLPSSDRRSSVATEALHSTCGQCHKSIQEGGDYLSYSGLVHRRQKAYEANPLFGFWQVTSRTVGGFFGRVRALFG